MPGRRRPRRWVRILLRLPTRLFHARLDRFLGRRFLMLTHVGRRSGRRYETVVEVVGRHPATGEYLVMSGFGRDADWYRNILAGGARQVAVGGDRFVPAVRTLPDGEAVAALEDYERRNRVLAPVVRAVLSRLVGWRYTGIDEQRRRLVRERPLVAFRPVDGYRGGRPG